MRSTYTRLVRSLISTVRLVPPSSDDDAAGVWLHVASYGLLLLAQDFFGMATRYRTGVIADPDCAGLKRALGGSFFAQGFLSQSMALEFAGETTRNAADLLTVSLACRRRS